jgi:hypothetical protein
MTPSLASSSNSTLINSPALSAKAAGKRPARGSPDKNLNANRSGLSIAQDRTPPIILQHQQEAVVPHGKSFERSRNTHIKSHETGEVRNMAMAETPKANFGANFRVEATAPMMARSQSNIESQQHRPREMNLGRPLPPSMITPKSHPVAKKVADVAVQVQFDSESVTAQGDGGIARDLPDSITIASRPSTSSLYTPTQPSPTPAPFLGRSKSQLTLLLEKMDQGKPRSTRDTKPNEHF